MLLYPRRGDRPPSVAEGHRAIVLSARYTENAAPKLHYAVEALNNNLQTFIE
jgi:hypothetical protein